MIFITNTTQQSTHNQETSKQYQTWSCQSQFCGFKSLLIRELWDYLLDSCSTNQSPVLQHRWIRKLIQLKLSQVQCREMCQSYTDQMNQQKPQISEENILQKKKFYFSNLFHWQILGETFVRAKTGVLNNRNQEKLWKLKCVDKKIYLG